MVHFQTRIDLTSNMKQFTTYSNMLQVGQLWASEKESSIYENLLLADMQSQLQTRIDLTLNMKQFTTFFKYAAGRATSGKWKRI